MNYNAISRKALETGRLDFCQLEPQQVVRLGLCLPAMLRQRGDYAKTLAVCGRLLTATLYDEATGALRVIGDQLLYAEDVVASPPRHSTNAYDNFTFLPSAIVRVGTAWQEGANFSETAIVPEVAERSPVAIAPIGGQPITLSDYRVGLVAVDNLQLFPTLPYNG